MLSSENNLQCSDVKSAVNLVYSEYTQIIATLIRYCNSDFQLAEDVFQDALVSATEQWKSKLPSNPIAWVYTVAKRRAIDSLRRNKLLEEKKELIKHDIVYDETIRNEKLDVDDKLRLIFTCCHPSLNLESQIALTLQVVAGLNAKEVARSFLLPESTMAQRLVRSKRKIKVAKIPYTIPNDSELNSRLESVLTVIYLIFNEGYTATGGNSLQNIELSDEAIRLGKMLSDLIPTNTEVISLYAMMLLHDARKDARTDNDGNLITLEDQNRTLWNHVQIKRGLKILHSILLKARPNSYVIQASIAALHSEAKTSEATDWKQISLLYRSLYTFLPTRVVELNLAVVIGMSEGASIGLEHLNNLTLKNELKNYHLLYSAKADFYRRLNDAKNAIINYKLAISYCKNKSEIRFLKNRIEMISINI